MRDVSAPAPTRPSRPSGNPNVAPAPAMTKSHDAASSTPGAEAVAVHGGDHRHLARGDAPVERVGVLEERAVLGLGLAAGVAGEVAAAAERPAVPGEHDAAHGGVGLGESDGVDDLVAVPPGRPEMAFSIAGRSSVMVATPASAAVGDLVELHGYLRPGP